jgi:hypothetical protein
LTQSYSRYFDFDDERQNLALKKKKNYFKAIADADYFCIVQNLSKKSRFSDDDEIETYLDNFFIIADLEENFSFINANQILNKCTILKNEVLNEIFVSRCSELKEHN